MSRITLPMSLLVLCLSACSGPQPDEQQQAVAQSEQRAEAASSNTDDQAPPADASACDATQVQWIVGKTPTDADLDQAKADAGAGTVRVLKPDQQVTMEFNAARLNIEVDAKGVATASRCG